jgi:nucleotide-binding universal stress UspA family protein
MLQTPIIEAALLAPVDFSAASEEALLLAAQLANCWSKPLVVLHVAHGSGHRQNTYLRRNEQEQILPIEEIAERMLYDYMANLSQQYPYSEVLANARKIVVCGLPATRIPEIARQIGAGLIVMGGNGRSSLSKLIGGSVSEKVIRQSPVPVTIIHSNGAALERSRNDVRQADGAESSHSSAGLG